MDKLQTLADIEGFEDGMAMAEELHTESVIPGICMNEGCEYSTGVEPDCAKGWCEECNTGSVKSFLMLMGII